jgi:hypothetical protein
MPCFMLFYHSRFWLFGEHAIFLGVFANFIEPFSAVS